MAKAGKRVGYIPRAIKVNAHELQSHMLEAHQNHACNTPVVAPAETSAVHPQAQAYLDALPPNMPMPETDIPLPKFRAAIDARTK